MNCATDTAPPSVKSSKNRGAVFASSLAIIEGYTETMPGLVLGATRAGEHAGDKELARDEAGEAERGAAAAAGRAAISRKTQAQPSESREPRLTFAYTPLAEPLARSNILVRTLARTLACPLA